MMKNKLNIALVSISILMFFIFPTSFGGMRYSVSQEILSWSLLSGCIVWFLMSNKINYKNIMVVLLMLIYMIIATFFANFNEGFDISVARVAPVLCASFLFLGGIKKDIPFSYFERALHFMCLTMIVWNFLTMLNIGSFIDFVVSYYSQFYDYATEGQLLRGKPVFTFGVHNVAAFFYVQFFLLCRFAYNHNRNKIFIFYMVSMFFFTLLLRSTTSLGFSLIMMIILFFMTSSNLKMRLLLIISMFVGLGIFITSPIFETYKMMLFSKTNGFIPRYFSETTIFSNNLDMLYNNFLGIGFTIPRGELQAYFADSGFLVYLTMGSVFFLFTMYYLFFKYVKNNIAKKYRFIFLLTVVLFELSMPSLLYLKSIYFYLFAAFFYSSLDFVESVNKEENFKIYHSDYEEKGINHVK